MIHNRNLKDIQSEVDSFSIFHVIWDVNFYQTIKDLCSLFYKVETRHSSSSSYEGGYTVYVNAKLKGNFGNFTFMGTSHFVLMNRQTFIE